MTQIRRKKYLVNRPVQLRYMTFVAIPLVVLLAGLYYLIYYAVFNEMLIPEAVAATLLPAMKKVNIFLLIAGPIALFIIFRRALVYSNRIYGPIPRIAKEIDKVLAGDYSVRIKARDNDDLKEFIDKVNLLVEKIEKYK